MDIRINTNTNINNVNFEASKPVEQQNQPSIGASLSVTRAPAAAVDDTMGIEVSEATLTRTDTLGKLISAAFNLAAPPMPEFK